jgi:hypothetical protein
VLPLEYRLRPRKAVALGGSALTLVGFALFWSAPPIREYTISADLLPSWTDFALVVSTLREKLATKRSAVASDADRPEA